MVDETKAVENTEVSTEVAATEESSAAGSESEVTWTPEQETEARQLHWSPKENWSGKPEDWQPPDKFLASIARSAPYWKGQHERVAGKLNAVESRLHQTESALHQLVETQSQAVKQAVANQLRALKIQHAEALSTGDTEKAVQISDQIDQAKEQLNRPAVQVAPQPVSQTVDPALQQAFSEWRASNPWFGSDPQATQYAQQLSVQLEGEGYTSKALLKEVQKQMQQKMPHLYGQASTSNVEETTRSGGNGRRYVPQPEEKALFDQMKDAFVGDGKPFKNESEYWAKYQADKRARS